VVAGAVAYNVYWSTAPGTTTLNGTKISGVSSPYLHAGLTNNTTYYYVVTAENGSEETSESAEVSAVPSSGSAQAGIPWSQAATNAEWGPRLGHASTVFANRIWVMGGIGWIAGASYNDVWSSDTGALWDRATFSAGWSPRRGHASIAFNNAIWVIGGQSG
jgi:hypothetical protein